MGLREYGRDELWGPKGRNARPKAENYQGACVSTEESNSESEARRAEMRGRRPRTIMRFFRTSNCVSGPVKCNVCLPELLQLQSAVAVQLVISRISPRRKYQVDDGGGKENAYVWLCELQKSIKTRIYLLFWLYQMLFERTASGLTAYNGA